MMIDANSVNIKISPAERRYHHGDLRAALIDAGMRMLERGDADQLSLREIARSVGVSAPAVYRHFPDKAALLAVLAVEGLERLGEAQVAALEAAGGGEDGFNAAGRAYVRFALANPALFRLIMGHAPSDAHAAALSGHASQSMRLLRTSVAELAPPGTHPDMLHAVAMRAWSQVHGLAMLMLDNQIEPNDALIDRVIDGREMWPD
jgi:AcrR family transcriptional regulator